MEVAWAQPDHPTARWEAKVIAVRARKAKVRFLGFDASWDTWLPHDSDELFPARAGIVSLQPVNLDAVSCLWPCTASKKNLH